MQIFTNDFESHVTKLIAIASMSPNPTAPTTLHAIHSLYHPIKSLNPTFKVIFILVTPNPRRLNAECKVLQINKGKKTEERNGRKRSGKIRKETVI